MKPKTEKELLAKPGVVGVVTGKKIKGGKKTTQDAIIVLVEKKCPLHELTDPAPQTIDGVPTDVVEIGTVKANDWGVVKPLETVERMRPALGGCSVGHFAITAGTLGVVADYNGEKVIFSNNHVLANSNDARQLDAIYQPGPYDGASADDVIGYLEKFIPIKFDGTANRADAAFANAAQKHLALGIKWVNGTTDVVVPTGFHRFRADEKGWKHGRTTDYTELNCMFVNATIRIEYGPGKIAVFEGCDIFDPPGASAGGDSGSVIMFGDKMGSHLFAGSDQVTVGTPIQHAFDALGLKIATPEVEQPPPPEPEPPTEGIEPVELLSVYLDGKVQIKQTISVENGRIVVR